MDINNHLKLYNLKEFDSFEEIAEYSYELAQNLNINKNEYNLLNNRPDETWSSAQHLKFYNTVSGSPFLREIIFSEKYDSYAECANIVTEKLTNNPRKILDIGCSIGHLTTWYAKYFPASKVVGIDNAAQSIQIANELSNSIGIRNAQFHVMDFNKLKFSANSFDVVIDTQSIYFAENCLNVFKSIKTLLSDDGCLISIPSIGKYDKLVEYADTILNSSLSIKSFEFIPINNLGSTEWYMVFVADKVSIPKQIDFREKWVYINSLMSN